MYRWGAPEKVRSEPKASEDFRPLIYLHTKVFIFLWYVPLARAQYIFVLCNGV